MPHRSFAAASAVGAAVWASAFATVGFVGGRALGDDIVVALGVAVGLVLAVSVLVEGGRRLVQGARRRAGAAPAVTAVTR